MEKDILTKENGGFVHYLYKITNLLDNKYYIGVHSLKKDQKVTPLTDNYWGSGTLICLIIKELGTENFKKEIIFIGNTREEVLRKEAELVSLDTLNDPLNYNLALGGESFSRGRIPAYTKEGNKIIFVPNKIIEENNLIIVEDNPYYIFDKTKKSISIIKEISDDLDDNIKVLKHVLTDQDTVNREKTINRLKGKVLAVRVGDDTRTPVFIEKGDNRLLSGEYVGFSKGKKRSEEEKEKRRGSNNPSYNTMWITNGKDNKRVKRTVDLQIPEGWWKGKTLSLGERQNLIKIQKERSIPTTVRSLVTGREETVKLDKIFFKDNKLISAEYLQEIYEPINSWLGVAKTLNICVESVRKIRDFYISFGYSFSSTAKVPRPGRREVRTTLNKIMIHKNKTRKYVDKDLVGSFLQSGWKLGKV